MIEAFDRLAALPDGFFDIGTANIRDLFPNPTLVHLEGRDPRHLFISILLHGNERTGLDVMQRLLAAQGGDLPRSILLFIGNVRAAEQNMRFLPGQIDYNRCWPGSDRVADPSARMMQRVIEIAHGLPLFAAVDIHNNTGRNPHYACVNILNPHGLQLAAMFGRTTVYFTSPKGVQSIAFSDFCPSLVLECGQSSDDTSVNHAASFLENVLALDKIPGGNPDNLRLYHTVARVLVSQQFSISTGSDTDIQLKPELEDLNFSQLDSGFEFAGLRPGSNTGLVVINESDEDVTHEFFSRIDDKLVLQRKVTLSMYTNDERAIRQDCLCYLMEQLHIHA